ncbi:hypothetical protein Pmani_022994 [Petrolisthes manimaculis]|uniref:Uncharacterized protein n=1 Tax=Petrolisthes manimaculis TaxID=1843537 RepID=A0AAE1PAV5_9EUCA|nr:hypothetical protein Pmani_022994 [Petrolisthes manimaculis]
MGIPGPTTMAPSMVPTTTRRYIPDPRWLLLALGMETIATIALLSYGVVMVGGGSSSCAATTNEIFLSPHR